MTFQHLSIAYGVLCVFLVLCFLARLITRRNREAKDELLRAHVKRTYGTESDQPNLFKEPDE